MPVIDVSDPKVIIFLNENYAKEARIRLNWVTHHKKIVQQAATLTREPTNYYETDIAKHLVNGGLAATTRDHIAAVRNRRLPVIRDGKIKGIESLRHDYSIEKVGLSDPSTDPNLNRDPNNLRPEPCMRPVDPKTTKIIYKPKPEDGRLQYLSKRNKIDPEKRYYFAECASWRYGWRLKDATCKNAPRHGRNCKLMKELKSRVGPQPDPPHYPSLDAVTFC